MESEKQKWLREAMAHIKADRYPDAYQCLAEAYLIDPYDELVTDGLVLLNDRIVEGNYSFDPLTAAQFTMRGLARGKKGELNASLNDFDRAIELDSDYHLAHACRGYALHLKGQYSDGIESYMQAIGIAPERGDYFDKLAESFEAMGDLESAHRAHRQAVKVNPDIALFHYNYGVLLMQHYRAWKEALALFERAIEIWPKYEDAIVNRTFVLEQIRAEEMR